VSRVRYNRARAKGYWLLVIGCWLSVIGGQLLVISGQLESGIGRSTEYAVRTRFAAFRLRENR